MIKCEECGKKFKSQKALNGHMIVHKKGNFECDECGEEFESQPALNAHKGKHKREKTGKGYKRKYQCDICGKKIVSKEGLRRHMVVHNPELKDEVWHWRHKISKAQSENNPSLQDWVKEKISKTMKKKAKNGEINPYGRGHYGNGCPPTPSVQKLLDYLPNIWENEVVFLTKEPRDSGYPTNYKIDIGILSKKFGIEVDGNKHNSKKAKTLDKKKTEFLKSRGWTIIRIRNEQVNKDFKNTLNKLKEVFGDEYI